MNTRSLGSPADNPPPAGMYKGGSFKFTFAINNNYPHEPPKVKCVPKVYHPNLDLDGNVCLNILREDWKPVLNLNAVMVGLQYLFLEPNADDPLNKGGFPCSPEFLVDGSFQAESLLESAACLFFDRLAHVAPLSSILPRRRQRPAPEPRTLCPNRRAVDARRFRRQRDI